MTPSTPVMEARDLTRYYGTTVGVEALSLAVHPGEIFGFLGPNGAGKTTTIRLLLDLIRPTRGQAFLFGAPSSDPAFRARVGHLPGELSLDGRMSGEDTLRFLGALDGVPETPSKRDRRRLLCQRLGLTRDDLRRKVREYSRGMKQKLGLVAAFQHNPELLILDEPTTGLDPLVREVVFDLMMEARDGGATIFHSSHVLSEVDRSCDRVAVLRDGRLSALLSVQEARKASVRRMSVEFQGPPPLDALENAGARLERISGNRAELRVPGEIQPLLQVLARASVRHLSFPEPTLEEAFNGFYRGTEGQDPAQPPASGPPAPPTGSQGGGGT